MKNTIVIVILIVLVIITAVQAVQLNNMKSGGVSGSTVKVIDNAPAPTGQAVSVPSNIQNLPKMVGGC